MVDEVEQAVVRRVQVFEDEYERALVGERLEEAAPGGEGLPLAFHSEVRFAADADERSQMSLDPLGLTLVGDDRLDRGVQLVADVLG